MQYRMTFKFNFLLLFIGFLMISGNLKSEIENNQIVIGKTIKIFSNILNEERTILISLPDEYEKSMQYYPVLYRLDGSEVAFYHTIGTIRHLENKNRIPKLIIVSISNNARHQDMRSRDMFPMKVDNMPNSGGANKFLDFISEELIPYINNNFRTTQFQMLFGESNAAMFTIHTLLKKPELFDAYLASSPPLAWGDYFLLKKAEKSLKDWSLLNKYLYISYGSQELTLVKYSISYLGEILNRLNPQGLNWKFKQFKQETHCPHIALHDGLKHIFLNWTVTEAPEMVPTNSIFLENNSIDVKLKSKYKNIRYTLDGNEPTRNSFLYSKPININTTTTIKAKIFTEDKRESNTIIGKFTVAPKSVALDERTRLNTGLRFKYYEGIWNKLPEYDMLIPEKSGIAKVINLDHRKRKNGFALFFNGLILIPQDGVYRFYLNSNDGSQLYIDKQLVIDQDSELNSYTQQKSWQVVFKAGYHPISVRYFQYLGNFNLDLQYEGPGIKKQAIPNNVLFHIE